MEKSAEYLSAIYRAQQQGISFDDAKSLADAGIDPDDLEAVTDHLDLLAAREERESWQDVPEAQIRGEQFEERLAMYRNEY